MNQDPIKKLVDELKRLPGIGERTAIRLAFAILREDKGYAERLSKAVSDLKDGIKLCSLCHNFTVSDPCPICSNTKRHENTICVVADPTDIMAFERSGSFRGLYHVLHGLISPLDGVGPADIRVNELKERIKNSNIINEVILATDATIEGEATALYLSRILRPLKVQISRLASGVPMGAKLQYLDPATISLAMDKRHPAK